MFSGDDFINCGMLRNKIVLLGIIVLCFFSCESLKRAYVGMKKPEIKTREASKVLSYYEPFLNSRNYQAKVYVFAGYDAAKQAVNDFGVPTILIKDRDTNAIYELNCFEDIEANITDINNNIINDYIVVKDINALKAFEEAVDNSSKAKLIYSDTNITKGKKWDVYISYATFMGKKLRKLTLPVTKLNGINEMIILDLSIDKSFLEIN